MSSANIQLLSNSLKKSDSQLYNLIKKERQRQIQGLELIASENFTSFAVLECLGSCLTNKYSEGLPKQRYYGGNEYIDEIELLCQSRALEAFNLNPAEWGVNVQPYSGSPANFAVYTALVGPKGRIMGLDLPDGGHLTHGYKTSTRNVSATSLFFESVPYNVDPETGLIDYDKLKEKAHSFKPNLICAGISAYARCLDYEKFRKICDEHNAYLFSDMAHVSGLVAAGVIPSPFQYSDIVSTTTHKTLRGPRAGMIFFRKGSSVDKDLESKINNAVFPGLQGGPHNNAIAAIATSLLQVKSEPFKKYQNQVVKNAKALAKELEDLGLKVITGGTDIHLFLADLKPLGVKGAVAEHVLDEIGIACNKNTVPGDKSALSPTGIRLGTPALTTRGLLESDMKTVADFIYKGLTLAKDIQQLAGPKLSNLKQFVSENKVYSERIRKLKNEVLKYAEKLFMPHDVLF